MSFPSLKYAGSGQLAEIGVTRRDIMRHAEHLITSKNYDL